LICFDLLARRYYRSAERSPEQMIQFSGFRICLGGPRGRYLGSVTPTWRHSSSRGQLEQRGFVPVQICLPKGTSRLLISTQYFFGSFDSKARMLCSGEPAWT
jgi:hypothetical protein